jgi:peptide deformylase
LKTAEEYHLDLTPEQTVERGRKPLPFHVLINPRIVGVDPTTVEFFEGCLSVAGYSALVARSQKVIVEYLNERAEPQQVEASGWYARILQHELDHLDGTLYIDKMQSRTMTTFENMKRLWQNASVADIHTCLG